MSETSDCGLNEETTETTQTTQAQSIGKNKDKLFGIVYGVGVNVNNVIGSGIVTSPGIIWKAVKSPEVVLLLWLICGLVALSGSLSYVELGVIHKISGGETKYLQTAYPHPRDMMSYLFSFMYIFAIQPGILSAILQSAAQYFWFTINGHDQEITQSTSGWFLSFSPFWIVKIIAVTLLLIITVYHMLSNKWANYINQTLAVIKLVTYSTIAIAGIYKLANPDNRLNWKRLEGNTDITAYSTSILLIMFSYNGWNSLNYSLDEFRKPEKRLIYSNSISVAIVIIVYLLVNVAFISVVPEHLIVSSDPDEVIAATFFHQLFGKSEAMVRIFTALVVLSVMGTAAAEVWGGSRVIVAAAKSDFFSKYSQELRTWNIRFNTPVNALLAQFVWCSLIIFFIGSSFTLTTFTLFSKFAMYSYWIFYFFTGIGLLIIRKNNITKSLLTAGPFILGGLYILTFSFIVKTDDCQELESQKCRIQNLSPIFISYGFLSVALVLYYWWKTMLYG
ncbi:hypothetical protein RclHR1_04530003 [Rhizophagus clarus]|uniref:Amino acid/polyamine transporter I n=1 Tax=Rhizophagus clarus TaxID=94130 RepID=A0A2Z6RJI5_9GLOM|nr:hypothetical protein RclHR1_04530003 [Rhizophagus clarus]GET02800.1 amino acid/polyamine transporter I [Rhizophagus clarus]